MIIDFEAKQTFNQQLDIPDPGNCCIKCETESWLIYYLVMKSIRGQVFCIEYGPIAPDSLDLPPDFYVKYSVLKFNEKKLFGKISSFLNDPKKEISSAIIDVEENAYDDFPEIIDAYKNIS